MPQNRTAQTIIDQALRAIGAIATGETPTSDERSEGLEYLQDLIAQWSTEALMIPFIEEREEFTLTANTNSYTIGSGGGLDTTRPIKIIGAQGKGSSNVEYRYAIIDAKSYRDISLKTTGAQPYWLWYNPNYDTAAQLGDVYLYPTPSSTDTLYLDSLKPIEEPSALATTTYFPEGYNRALRLNLALDMNDDYGTLDGQRLARLEMRALQAKRSIKNLNAQFRVSAVKLDLVSFSKAAQSWTIENV